MERVFSPTFSIAMPTKYFEYNNISMLVITPDERTWNQPYLDVTPESLNTSNTSHMGTGEKSIANMTVEEYLDYLNTSFAAQLLPALVVLAALMAMGVVGNILVLFMYTCRSKRGTVTLFIQALAVFDLLSCCVAIPGEIIDMTNNYTFGRHSLCKIMRTVNLFCTVSSGATLVVVAIDRYKRICCPLRKQIAPKGATIVICICAVSALVISLPTAILYGSRSISTDLSSVNGTDCSISDQFANTVFPIAYNGLQMLLFLVGAVTLIVLYSLIGSKVCHHVNQQQVRRKSSCAARSRFSPGGVSTCTVYSGNMNTACRVESELSSCVNGFEATELTERVQSTDMHVDGTVSVMEHLMSNEEEHGAQFNNSNRQDYLEVTGCTDKNASLLTHGIDYQKMSVSVEECEAKLYGHKNELVDKCGSISGNNFEVELENDVPNVKNSVEEEKIFEFKQKAAMRVENQIVERTGRESLTEMHRSKNPINDEVYVGKSKSESHLKRFQAQVFTDRLVSAADRTCSQLDACSQSVNILSVQTITSFSAQNGGIKTRDLLIPDSTIVHDESSFRSSSALSSGPPGKSAKASNLDDECYKIPNLIDETINNKPHRDIGRQDNGKRKVSPVESGNSNINTKLQTNNNFSIQTSKSTETNANLDGKECKKGNNQIGTSNNLVLRPKTKKRENSFKLKQKYTSIVSDGNTSLVRQMSRTAARSDGNVEEKVKVRDKEHNDIRRTTLMLLMITVIYVLSFLPHLVLMALKAVNKDILTGLGTTWELAQNLLIRSYFINSMANPIIYSFFSRNFFARCRDSRTGRPRDSRTGRPSG